MKKPKIKAFKYSKKMNVFIWQKILKIGENNKKELTKN